jgi:hypothetical protein
VSLGSGCSKLGWQLCTAWQRAQKELQRRAHMPKIGSFDRTALGQLSCWQKEQVDAGAAAFQSACQSRQNK